MPYIGRSTDGFGVRSRFVYLASSGDTSVSGADANGATLTFTDGAYVDVYLNGILLKPTTDYNTSTANTIAGLSALNTNDEVTVVVYDVFTVADMVSATSGGTFNGNITISSTDASADGNPNLVLYRNSASPADQDQLGQITFRSRNDNSQDIDHAQITTKIPDVSDGTEDANMEIAVISNGSLSNRLTMKGNGVTSFSNQNLKLNNINLVVGTSGKGIDFSAETGSASGSTSALLDDYEEGTFTPTIYGTSGSAGSQQINGQEGKYVKVGRLVYVTLYFYLQNGGAGSWSGTNRFGGFPFTSGTANWQALSIGADGLNADEHTFTISGGQTYGHMVDMYTGTAFNYSSFVTGYSIQVSGSYYTT